jgi:APA family basic amino acid/polyamine antiporter
MTARKGSNMTSPPGTGSLFRTKSVEQSIADTDEPDSRLRRELGALDLTIFGVAVLIGAGIFTITARTAGDVAGPAIAVSFVIAAVACGFAGLCYAEFASTVPVAGSAYTFSYATFGEFIAWIIGWDLILEYALGAATVAKSWSSYLGTVFDVLGLGDSTSFDVGPVEVDWGAILVIAALTVVLVLGIKLSSRVSTIITSIKLLAVRVRPGRGGDVDPPLPAAEPAAQLHRHGAAGRGDPRRRLLPLADAQPDRGHVGPVHRLDGRRRRGLLRLLAPQLRAGEARAG